MIPELIHNATRPWKNGTRMPRTSSTSLSMLLSLVTAVSGADPAVPDPVLSDWQGAELVAQVIPRGDGSYPIDLLPAFDVKCQPLAVLAGQARS